MQIIRPSWECRCCHGMDIVEVAHNGRTKTLVEGYLGSDDLIFGHHELVEPGEVQIYECRNCGAPVMDDNIPVTNRKQLVNLLKGANHRR